MKRKTPYQPPIFKGGEFRIKHGDVAVSNLAAGGAKIEPDRRNQGGLGALNSLYLQGRVMDRGIRNRDNRSLMSLLTDIELACQILVGSCLSPKDLTSLDPTVTIPEGVIKKGSESVVVEWIKNRLFDEYEIKAQLPRIYRDVLFERGSFPVAVIPENALDEMMNGTPDSAERRASVEGFRKVMGQGGAVWKSLGYLKNPVDARASKPSSLDEFLRSANVSNESFSTSLISYDPEVYARNEAGNYLRDGEGKKIKTGLSIIDNPAILAVPKYHADIAAERLDHRAQEVGMGIEGLSDSAANLRRAFERTRRKQVGGYSTAFKEQGELSRSFVGKPLVMSLPNESVTLVYPPGEPEKYLGAIVAVDEFGHPINATESVDLSRQLGAGNGFSGNPLMSSLTQRVNSALGEDSRNIRPSDPIYTEMMSRLCGEMVEKEFLSRWNNHLLGRDVVVGDNGPLYRLMLSRFCENRAVRMVYVPRQYLTYIALDYDPNGVGESLVDKQNTICVMRLVMLFTDITSGIRNSIPTQVVSIKLDENTPDSNKAIEIIADELVNRRVPNLPSNPSDLGSIFKFIGQSGMIFEINGAPGLPDHEIKIEQTKANLTTSETTTSDMLRDMCLQGFSCTPEMIQGYKAEQLATVSVNNNIALAKRTIAINDQLEPQVTDYYRKLLRFDRGAVTSLYNLLVERDLVEVSSTGVAAQNSGGDGNAETDEVRVVIALRAILDGFRITMPRPSNITTKAQSDELEDYGNLLDKAIGLVVPEEMLSEEAIGPAASAVKALVATVKSAAGRRFMAEKNILPELIDLIGGGDATVASEKARELSDNVKQVLSTLIYFARNTAELKKVASADAKAVGIDADAGDSAYGSGYGSNDGGASGTDVGDDLDFDAGGDGEIGDFNAGAGTGEEEKPEGGNDAGDDGDGGEAKPEGGDEDKAADNPGQAPQA